MELNETLFPNWQKESWQTFEETSGWILETGTGQQVAQLHYRYMMMMVPPYRVKAKST
jgi:hypothetical protein